MQALGSYTFKEDASELSLASEVLQKGLAESFKHVEITDRKDLFLSLRARNWTADSVTDLHQAQTARLGEYAVSVGHKRRKVASLGLAVSNDSQSSSQLPSHLQPGRGQILQAYAASVLKGCLEGSSPCTSQDPQAIFDMCSCKVPFKHASQLLRLIYNMPNVWFAGRMQEAGLPSEVLSQHVLHCMDTQLSLLRDASEQVLIQTRAEEPSISELRRSICVGCGKEGRKWTYLASLVSYVHREDLLSSRVMMSWFKKHLQNGQLAYAEAVLIPFLASLLPGLRSVQQHLQWILDFCKRKSCQHGTNQLSNASAQISFGRCYKELLDIITQPGTLITPIH